jgi:hypothetical protein
MEESVTEGMETGRQDARATLNFIVSGIYLCLRRKSGMKFSEV